MDAATKDFQAMDYLYLRRRSACPSSRRFSWTGQPVQVLSPAECGSSVVDSSSFWTTQSRVCAVGHGAPSSNHSSHSSRHGAPPQRPRLPWTLRHSGWPRSLFLLPTLGATRVPNRCAASIEAVEPTTDHHRNANGIPVPHLGQQHAQATELLHRWAYFCSTVEVSSSQHASKDHASYNARLRSTTGIARRQAWCACQSTRLPTRWPITRRGTTTVRSGISHFPFY
jgi:hypothetical protein